MRKRSREPYVGVQIGVAAAPSPEDMAIELEAERLRTKAIAEILPHLPSERHRRALVLRYGLEEGCRKPTLKEIGLLIGHSKSTKSGGSSRERVRQMIEHCLAVFRRKWPIELEPKSELRWDEPPRPRVGLMEAYLAEKALPLAEKLQRERQKKEAAIAKERRRLYEEFRHVRVERERREAERAEAEGAARRLALAKLEEKKKALVEELLGRGFTLEDLRRYL